MITSRTVRFYTLHVEETINNYKFLVVTPQGKRLQRWCERWAGAAGNTDGSHLGTSTEKNIHTARKIIGQTKEA
jgi:hypothetical protein